MEQTNDLKVSKPSFTDREGDTESSITMQEKEKDDLADTELAPNARAQEANIDGLLVDNEAVENTEYISGFKLALLLFSLVTFFFLLMLDSSIISTVS